MDVIFEALGLTGIESVRRRSDLRQVITRVRETLYPLRLHESSEAAIVLFAIAVAEARLADVSWLAMVRMISRIYDVPLLDRSQPEPDPASPPAGKAKLPCPADLAIETIRVLRADEAINPGLERWLPAQRYELYVTLIEQFQTAGIPDCDGSTCGQSVTEAERLWLGWPARVH